MKRLFLAGIATAIVATAAGATDNSKNALAKSEPATAIAPATPRSWTGCYIGGHIGGAWGGEHWSAPSGFELASGAQLFSDGSLPLDQAISGGIAGGQVSCRYQISPRWTIGIGGDFSSAKILREDALTPFVTPPGVGVPTTLTTRTNWVASATGMVGYAFDRLLFYGKGGAAWAANRYEIAVNPATFASSDFQGSETRAGWTVGGGIEYAVTRNLSTNVEFDYYDFGRKAVTFVDQSGVASSVDLGGRLNTIKFGVNYKLWDADPSGQQSSPLQSPVLESGDAGWTETIQTETRYYSWKSNRGFPTNLVTGGGTPQPVTASGSGSELYIPYALQVAGHPGDAKVELLWRGGWVQARQSTAGIAGEVSTATDTVASATVTYLGIQGIQPFAALEMNLPTGSASLPGTAANARMDPDLVDVASFGEGFNFGPSLGFNLPITDTFIFSMSAGYTRRGSFMRESSLTPPSPGGPSVIPSRIDPGNVLTLTSSVGYQIGAFTGKVTGTVSEEAATKVNDAPFVHAGRRYLVSGNGSYRWPFEHAGVTTLNAAFSHSNRNDVLFVYTGAPTLLIPEPNNTNSNLYQVSLEHLFLWDQFAIGPTGSLLHREHNSYDPTTVQFVPAKDRWSAGVIAKYAPDGTITFNARVERVWTREDENPAPGDEKYSILALTNGTAFTVPVISSTGWQFAVGATAKF